MKKLFLFDRVQSAIVLPAMAIFVAVWMPALTSQAQLNITNSSSPISVSATCNSQTASNAISADGYIYVSAPNQPNGSYCWASGRMESSVSSTSVSVDLDGTVNTTFQNAFFPDAVSLSASATATKTVSFYVTVPQSVQVQRHGSDIILFGNGTNFYNSIPSSFLLFPGSYTLSVSAYPSFSHSVPAGFRAGFAHYGPSVTFDVHLGLQTAPAPGPFIMSLSSNATFVFGASNALTVQAAGTAPFSYQWRREGTNLIGATNSTIVFPSADPTIAGLYTVVVTNAYKSITSSVVQVTVGPPPPPPPSISQVRRLGNGLVQITVTNLSGSPLSVLASTNIALPVNQWANVGSPVLVSNDVYQFTDLGSKFYRHRFFRLRWP